MARDIETRPVKPHCTCDSPFGCVIHDPNLDGLTFSEPLPHDDLVDIAIAASELVRCLEYANGDVYAIDCAVAGNLEFALDALARHRLQPCPACRKRRPLKYSSRGVSVCSSMCCRMLKKASP